MLILGKSVDGRISDVGAKTKLKQDIDNLNMLDDERCLNDCSHSDLRYPEKIKMSLFNKLKISRNPFILLYSLNIIIKRFKI